MRAAELPVLPAPSATKLRPPPLRPGVVERQRLRTLLDATWDHRVLLVSAPAGSGKTTLLATWAATHGGRVAWLSLDAADDEPVRFWTGCLGALRRIRPDAGEAALARLRSSLRAPSLGAVVDSLIDSMTVDTLDAGVGEVTSPPDDAITLVLDDYHVVDRAEVHDAVAYLVEHLPPALHLVLAGRIDPPLPLARWRGAGHLVEVRADDLRFRRAEAAHFLGGTMGLQLAPEEVAALEARTEGWAAGLQLAALSLRGRDEAGERSRIIAAFGGSHRFVLDYLMEEVFDRQEPEVRRFLSRTAVLDRLCAPLCDAVTGEPGGAAMLDTLERANLFIVPLDDERHWYRYHHLFGALLRARLRQYEGGLVATLYGRAADWCRGQALWDEAVRYALAAGDVEAAASLVEAQVVPTTRRGDVPLVRSWLALLPPDVVRLRPRLALAAAVMCTWNGDPAAVEGHLGDAERALRLAPEPDVAAEIGALRGFVALLAGDLARCDRLLGEALPALPPDDPLRPLTLFSQGELRQATGDHALSGTLYEAAVGASLDNGNPPMALVALGGLVAQRIVAGDLSGAAAAGERGVVLARAQNLERTYGAASVHAALGRLEYERNHLDAASEHLTTAVEIARANEFHLSLIPANEALAQTYLARRQPSAAWAALAEAEQAARGMPGTIQQRVVASARVRLALLDAVLNGQSGIPDAARTWAAEDGPGVDQPLPLPLDLHFLTLARLQLLQPSRREQGRRLLTRLEVAARAAGRDGRLVAILAVQSLERAVAADLPAALATLAEALRLAAPLGHVRTFLDLGSPLIVLLRRLVAAGTVGGLPAEYATQLLIAAGPASGGDVAGAPSGESMVEPITERETAVLRLMAAGLTNGEIAADLVVTLATVKTHVQHVFEKLAVNDRRAAVRRAREVGLLSADPTTDARFGR